MPPQVTRNFAAAPSKTNIFFLNFVAINKTKFPGTVTKTVIGFAIVKTRNSNTNTI